MSEEMKLTPLEELLDEHWGPIGTPKRDEMEQKAALELLPFYIGRKIKELRKEQGMTQDELGKLAGVKKSWVCTMEKGQGGSMRFDTLYKILTALGVKQATLQLGSKGEVELWDL